MTAVVFETPGLIDLRAFTIMGAHAKPKTDNPIGFFGTGLKYAVAVLVRLGASPTAYVGRDRLRFSRRTGATFRGAPLDAIKMDVLKAGNVRATTYELPFTTRYGERWEPWMAFRELESNTRDEGGRTYTIPSGPDFDLLLPSEDMTRIVVVSPEEFVATDVDDVFLRRGRRSAPGTILEAFPGESERLWYRTMRALDLPKPTLMTYNFLEELALTEDRTVAHQWATREAFARWVLTSATADEVELIVKADEEHWEHDLSFPSWVAPSAAFVEVMRDRKKPAPPPTVATWASSAEVRPRVEGRINRNAFAYFGPRSSAYAPAPVAAPKAWSLADEYPRPWRVEGGSILDAKGKALFTQPDDFYDSDDWARVADAVVRRINMTVAPRRDDLDASARLDADLTRFSNDVSTLIEDLKKEEMPF